MSYIIHGDGITELEKEGETHDTELSLVASWMFNHDQPLGPIIGGAEKLETKLLPSSVVPLIVAYVGLGSMKE